MNIIENSTFKDPAAEQGTLTICPGWHVSFAGSVEENAFVVSEEKHGSSCGLLLAIASVNRWFRLSQPIQPILGASEIQLTLRCHVAPGENDRMLSIRLMEVNAEGYQNTITYIANPFALPTCDESMTFKIPAPASDREGQYALVLEVSETMHLSLIAVVLEYLDASGDALSRPSEPASATLPTVSTQISAPETIASNRGLFRSSHKKTMLTRLALFGSARVESKVSSVNTPAAPCEDSNATHRYSPCSKAAMRAPTLSNPAFKLVDSMEIADWAVEADSRLGLRFDRFDLPSTVCPSLREFTRITTLETIESGKHIRFKTPIKLERGRYLPAFNLAILARADRLVRCNAMLVQGKSLLAESPLVLDSGWTEIIVPLPEIAEEELGTSKTINIVLELVHSGKGHVDLACCIPTCANDFKSVKEFGNSANNRRSNQLSMSGPRQFVKNSSFSDWSRGIDFAKLWPGKQLADHWFIELRREQSQCAQVTADALFSVSNEHQQTVDPGLSLRVRTTKFIGPVRLYSTIDLDILNENSLQLRARLSSSGRHRVSHIRKIQLLARGLDRESVVHTFTRKLRVRYDSELNLYLSESEMAVLRTGFAGYATLILAIDFEHDSDILMRNVSLERVLADRINVADRVCRSDSLSCEDPAVISQLKSTKGVSHWYGQEVVRAESASRLPFSVRSKTDRRSNLLSYAAPTINRPYKGFPTVDIVVPIYNALESVRECIRSVIENTTVPYQLLCIDDASNGETADFLDAVAYQYPHVKCLRNDENLGYTRSVNRGFRNTSADYVCVLNSDCIVTPNWLEQLIDCATSADRIGMVGPLSNAASYQSVPHIRNAQGDWSFNPLPSNVTPAQVAATVYEHSNSSYPSVKVINGFCQLIASCVIDEIGLLDEEAFPKGFGEENDYCARVVAAGYAIHIADDTYVFHKKSQSFGNEQRKQLSALGSKALRAKHPQLDWKAITNAMESDPALIALRRILQSMDIAELH